MVEIFFGIIARQAIRRGSFGSRQRPQRHDPRLHRRLERTLPPLRLDQDRTYEPSRHTFRANRIVDGPVTPPACSLV